MQTFNEKPLLFDDGEKLFRIDLGSITYVEANRIHCVIHTIEGRKYELNRPLGKIEENLPKTCFVRVNRSVIVNVYHVYQVIGRQVYVDNSHNQIVVGVTYTDCLKNAFTVI